MSISVVLSFTWSFHLLFGVSCWQNKEDSMFRHFRLQCEEMALGRSTETWQKQVRIPGESNWKRRPLSIKEERNSSWKNCDSQKLLPSLCCEDNRVSRRKGIDCDFQKNVARRFDWRKRKLFLFLGIVSHSQRSVTRQLWTMLSTDRIEKRKSLINLTSTYLHKFGCFFPDCNLGGTFFLLLKVVEIGGSEYY